MAPSKKNDHVCVLCNTSEDQPSKFGKFLRSDVLSAHEYCLFFSSGLAQNGNEDTDLAGYLFSDIRKEVRRGAKLKCKFCKKVGATIGCCKSSCKISVHLPCGLKNRFQNLFYRSFKSYCEQHRKFQRPLRLSKNRVDTCLICFEKFSFDKFEHAYCPDCYRIFHRECLQENALSAGYFFCCPNCRNKRNFRKEMRSIGINVVRKDASWVSETDTLLNTRRTPQCDMEVCQCPFGRQHDQDQDTFKETPWELLICDSCNSNGTHAECAGMTFASDEECENWLCAVCRNVLTNSQQQSVQRPISQSNVAPQSNESRQSSSSSSESEACEETTKEFLSGSVPGKRRVNKNLLYEQPSEIRIIEVPDDSSDEEDPPAVAYIIRQPRIQSH